MVHQGCLGATFFRRPQGYVRDGPEILGPEAQLSEETGRDGTPPGVSRIHEESDVFSIQLSRQMLTVGLSVEMARATEMVDEGIDVTGLREGWPGGQVVPRP